MNIKQNYKGTVIIDLGVDSRNAKGDYETLYIDSTNLIEWYPFAKTADWRYNRHTNSVFLRANGGTNEENVPDIDEIELSVEQLEYGFVDCVYNYNRKTVDLAIYKFGLEDPEEFVNIADAENAISHVFLIIDSLEREHDLVQLYEKNDHIAEERMRVIDDNLELAGRLFQMYELYKKVL